MKPLKYSTQQITEADIEAVVRVLRSDHVAGDGPEVEAFEKELAEYVGAKWAVAVSSGTAALHLAYLVESVLPKPVVTSPLTFLATANAALHAGLAVSFVEVEPATGLPTLHPGSYAPTGLIYAPVHYAGRAASIPDVSAMGPGSVVIEDASHALGAMDFDGCSRVGSCAHSLATVFSFHAVKPITTGEGGAITTNNPSFAQACASLRSHGRDGGRMQRLGFNYRMTDVQAALGRSQLKRCDEMRERRTKLAASYWKQLRDVPYCVISMAAAEIMGEPRSALHLLPIRIKGGKRDAVKAALNAQGIMAQVHYPSMHLEPFYRQRFGYKPGDFPEAEAWSAEELSLPLHAGMTEADVTRVVDALRKELAA